MEFLGTVDYRLLAFLLLGSIPGIWLGSPFSNRINEGIVRGLLATILVFVGTKLVFN